MMHTVLRGRFRYECELKPMSHIHKKTPRKSYGRFAHICLRKCNITCAPVKIIYSHKTATDALQFIPASSVSIRNGQYLSVIVIVNIHSSPYVSEAMLDIFKM